MPKCIFISEGITDALDHSSPESLVGGKLGIDLTASYPVTAPEVLDSSVLLGLIRPLMGEVEDVTQYMRHTANPITIISVTKKRSLARTAEMLSSLQKYLRIVIVVDAQNNDIHNPYMLLWRVTNNMDAGRDIMIHNSIVSVDGTSKNHYDGFEREWPGDVNCTPSVIEKLKSLSLWDLDTNLEKKYQL